MREEKRSALIESAIQLIGEQGLDRATIPAVCKNAGLNEVYVHRLFGGRTELYHAVFSKLDREFSSFLMRLCNQALPEQAEIRREMLRGIFDDLWEFTLNRPNRCLTFIRIFYSRYYDDTLQLQRRELYTPVVERLHPYFEENVDCWEILNHVMDFLFCSALRVLREDRINEAHIANQTFSLIFKFLYLFRENSADFQ